MALESPPCAIDRQQGSLNNHFTMASSQSNQLNFPMSSRYGNVNPVDSELGQKGKARLPIHEDLARGSRGLLTDNSDPEWITFCPECQNISRLFATTPAIEVAREDPERLPWALVKNCLQHHSDVEGWSETCHLCALIGACVASVSTGGTTMKQYLDSTVGG